MEGVVELAQAMESEDAMAAERKDVNVAGPDLYLVRIVWKLADKDKGKMVVIDVDSGDFEADADEMAARKRLLTRRPDARTWTEEFQGPPKIRGSWRMTYPKGYTIEGGYPSREEIREALAKARRRTDD